MDKELAKSIPIIEILSKLNIEPKKVSNNKALYLSPLRNEKTPSFWVYTKTNRWYDYGEPAGGDAIDFVCHYLRSCNEAHTFPDALRWIKNMVGMGVTALPLPNIYPSDDSNESPLSLKSKDSVKHVALVRYLENRGIKIQVAQKYLFQVQVLNKVTNKCFFALGFKNEEGGYELRNPFFKGTLRPKAITFIRGNVIKPTGIHIFEGFMDYLSAVNNLSGNAFQEDTIVLNSISCLRQAFSYIHNFGYEKVYTWMDNDHAGRKADVILSEYFKSIDSITLLRMNRMYAPHKDVNAWHMHKHNLTI